MEYNPLGSMVNRKIGYGIVQPGQSVPDGVPVIKVNNLISGLKSPSELDTTARENEAKYSRTRLHGGELIVSVVGTIGKTAIVPKSFAGCNLVRATALIDIEDELMSKWVKYYFDSPCGQSYIEQNLNTTVQPTLNIKSLVEMPIPIRDTTEMEKTVLLLSALDEKIEVNRQINDNLQQQLFSLYENMATASPCSKEYTLSNLCDFQEGYVNPPQTHPEYFDGEVKWLRAVDINESFIIETSRTLTKAGFESAKKSALLFEPNTIAISKSGTIGRLGIIADYMCGNRAVINIAPHDTNMLAFIYCFLKSKQREFPDMAVGSVQKNLYVSLLEPLSVSIPDNESLTAFNAVGAPILGMIHNNCVENTDLANLRDTILPKLMSGELDVSSVLI